MKQKKTFQGKKLAAILIVMFGIVVSMIFLVDLVDENVTNPRIWKDWTCDEMKEFAIKFEDEKLTDFQRARFHDDLSLCMSR